jgi:drug/metabolite transporter (DMT)-like permease
MKNLQAIFWMVVTTLLFAIVTGIVRYIGSDIPAPVAAFIRYIISTIFFIPLMVRMFILERNRSNRRVYWFRGLAHGFGVILWFFAMARIPVSEVTAIGYITPIFVSIAAFIFLKETFSISIIGALAICMIGMIIIIRPTTSGIATGQLSMIIATLFFAASYILAKKLSETESTLEILVALNFVVTLTLAPFAIAFWVTPSLQEVLFLGVVALFATAGHFTMTIALKLAPITITQPISYVQIVWASGIGFIFFGETVTLLFSIGASLIILSSLYVTYTSSSNQNKDLSSLTAKN